MTVCEHCGDTHWVDDSRYENKIMCQWCPVPCGACRGAAFCKTTPCPCVCHKPKAKMKKTRAQYQTQISDGQLDPMSTEELQDLILRARWALYRRIRDASVALKESDPGSHWSPPTKDDDE